MAHWNKDEEARLTKYVQAHIGGDTCARLHFHEFPGKSVQSIRAKYRRIEDPETILRREQKAVLRRLQLAQFEADVMNKKRFTEDLNFQDAMRAAIDAGLERMPGPADYRDEHRPVRRYFSTWHYSPGSPAAACSELGTYRNW